MGEGSDGSESRARLVEALAANRAGSGVEHVCVAFPSFSIGESLLSHYADRIAALEHRYLLALFMLQRIEHCELVFLSCVAPGPVVLDYYLSIVPVALRASVASRLRIVEVPDPSARSVAAKLLDRPDLLEELRESVGARPALIEPWNVTDEELAVAERLGVPINGTPPALRRLGFKSDGRRLMAAAGVPLPVGCEDVRSVDDVVAAVTAIRAERPSAPAVIVKHDDSGAGDGNVVLRIDDLPEPGPGADATVRARLAELDGWYLDDLRTGGVVEERIVGSEFTSPSVQLEITPTGDVIVLCTHEQILAGDDGQVYSGCRFPARPDYAVDLARHGQEVGRLLAAAGAVGRVAVDFAAASDATGRWRVYGLELNLRKGGTTHPFLLLRHLLPGRYDQEEGRWVTDHDGSSRWYRATDNLICSTRPVLSAQDAIAAVRRAGLSFSVDTGHGVVLHMLSCLPIDGRCGYTAIGRSAVEAEDLAEATAAALTEAAERLRGQGNEPTEASGGSPSNG